jgi:hypothetical protein
MESKEGRLHGFALPWAFPGVDGAAECKSGQTAA